MIGYLWTAVYMFAVVGGAGAATGLPQALAARTAEPPERGWFPGGEEDEPEPQPQPEKHHRPVPSWARP